MCFVSICYSEHHSSVFAHSYQEPLINCFHITRCLERFGCTVMADVCLAYVETKRQYRSLNVHEDQMQLQLLLITILTTISGLECENLSSHLGGKIWLQEVAHG